MTSRIFVLPLAILALTAGCSGRNTPNNPENEQWFCQSNESGDGWECVQDANLAQVPVPTRMPPEPEPEPVNLDDPLDLDALTAPLERNLDLPPQPEPVPQVVPDSSIPSASEQLGPAASDPSGRSSKSAPPPPETTDSSTPPATQSSPQVPRHIALAYVPAEPTSILQLPADYFALQMLAMDTTEQVEQYINDNGLKGMSGARVENEGKLYYVLIVGIYENYERAQEASESLPPPLSDVEVSIRPLGSLQQAMIRAEDLADGDSF